MVTITCLSLHGATLKGTAYMNMYIHYVLQLIHPYEVSIAQAARTSVVIMQITLLEEYQYM